MSFPGPPVRTSSAFGADTTAHAANIGTTANGDRLVALFTNDGDATVTTPGGWNLLDSTPNGTAVRVSWYYRDTDGSDSGGTVDFVTSVAEHATATIWRIPAGSYDTGTAPQIGTAATGTSTTPDPPSVTPSWGSGIDTTYIVGFGKDDDDGSFGISQYPSNCYPGTWLRSTSGAITCSQASCTALADTASFNPGPFTGIASEDWVANTVAIRGVSPHGKPYLTNLTFSSSGTDASSYATASVSPPANTPIFAAVWSRISAGTPNQPTASGNGITWSAVASAVNGTDRVTLFSGSHASPSAGAVTFDYGGQTQARGLWTVGYWTHLDAGPVVQTKTATGTGTVPTGDFDNAFASADNVTLQVLGLASNTVTVTPEAGFFVAATGGGAEAGGIHVDYKQSEDQVPSPTVSASGVWEQILVELALDVGAQNLSGTLFQKAPTFSTGTITTGAVDLAGALFTKAPTFFQGTITVGFDLTGSLFTKAPTFFTGSIDVGALNLDGALFQKAPTFFTGTLTLDAITLNGVLFQNTPLFFQGSLTGGVVSAVRIAREAIVASHHGTDTDTQTRLSREGVTVAHHFPEANTASRISRLGVVIAISRPHGWD